jgi:hypothetical protein
MYLDSSPTTRRSADSLRRRGACNKPARQNAVTARPRPVGNGTRPRRLDDAIVSQWLLDQLPAERRHAVAGA